MPSSEYFDLTILHFNDVYNIEAPTQDTTGGAARFKSAIQQKASLDPLILFSGDVFNPSIMSTVTKGKQMVPVLNSIGVHCAVYGNHDFDFGIDNLEKLKSGTNFPWLLSNVVDRLTNASLADGIISKILEKQGKKIGLIGLVEEEWIATLSTIDPEDLLFIDFVERGQELARKLKRDGADYVIALTHMRWPNDERLATETTDIDLVLGGHDHDYGVKKVNGKYVVKSGTDFRQFSEIALRFHNNNREVEVIIHEISVTSQFEEDPEVKAIVHEFQKIMGDRLEITVGEMDVELEGRFSEIRTRETNLGNFITDIMLTATDADVALLNSGTLRSDRIHPKGRFKVKDLLSILPLCDPVVVIALTGAELLQALENGVSMYPKLEGRFPQVSGMSFAFDPQQPSGKRVDPRFVKVESQYLELEKIYRLATKSYLAEGKDGYDVFKNCPVLVNDEEGPTLSVIVQNHFRSLQIVKGERACRSPHRQSLVPLHRRRGLARQLTLPDSDSVSSCTDNSAASFNSSVFMSPLSTHTPKARDIPLQSSHSSSSTPMSNLSALSASERRAAFKHFKETVHSMEIDAVPSALAPQLHNRIISLTERTRQEFEEARRLHHIRYAAI